MGEHPASSAPLRQGPPRLLVIRRDNIGDLVCTTPLIAALRERYPGGHIAALVNTYNEAVLAGNPDVDAVYAYEKGKHRRGRSLLAVYADRARLIAKLRGQKFDYAILATPGFAALSLRLARWVGARHVLGYSDPGRAHARLDIALPYDGGAKTHEVERVFGLLKALGIKSSPPPTRVFPDPGLVVDPRQALVRLGSGTPVVGVHVSARRRNQQWPAENFAALIRAIFARHGARILLLWAPGDAANPTHPGDDDKAQAVVERCGSLSLLPWPTGELSRLIAALSVCDYVVCVDGGAMHIAAALQKPILCLFGDSPPERWRPWITPHELLQPPSRDLRDLSVEEALLGFERLALKAPLAQPGA